MPSLPFRDLCNKLRAVLKALPPERRDAIKGACRFLSKQSINASAFLGLCQRMGIDPLTGEAVAATESPAEFDLIAFGMNCVMRRELMKHSLRSAAKAARISYSTVLRAERGDPVSPSATIALCAFVGVHPFHYMANQKREAA